MKNITVILLTICALINWKPAFSQQKNVFFNDQDLMKIGVYYYPEQWSETQWDRDLGNIAKLGFTFTHFAEFSWAMLEPKEGVYDFAWLDKAIAIAAKKNLKVIMCTPTSCPPAWLTQKHPELLYVTQNGEQVEHGARGDYSIYNPLYMEYSKKIIEKLAEKYGNDTRIWGWQLDNEPAPRDDFSLEANAAFRQWLKKKYKDIATLNKSWGAAFWSLQYNNWEQVKLLNTNYLWGTSPHGLLDMKRFRADYLTQFLHQQNQILRKTISKDQWVTTNFIGHIDHANPALATDLDFVSYTVYPGGEGVRQGASYSRLGYPQRIQFASLFYKNIKKATGVMELQPGQVNWTTNNTQPAPGAVRMWLWHAFATDCKFACTYRYRQPLSGSEQYHGGIVGTDGVTLSQGGEEYKQVMSEMEVLKKDFIPAKSTASLAKTNKTAIIWNQENLWETSIQKQTSNWDFRSHVLQYVTAANRLGLHTAIINEENDLTQYNLVIAPAYQMLDSALVTKWTKYVEKGGNLVLSCRTGQKDRKGFLWEGKWASPILNLIGSEISFYDVLLPNSSGLIAMNGSEYPWTVWADILKPKPNTETIATYKDQYYKNSAAVVQNKIGKGTVTYIGVESHEGILEQEVIKNLCKKIAITTTDYPKDIWVNYRDGYWVATNYSNKNFQMQLPKNAKIVLGETNIPSPGVLVWKE